MSSVSRINFIPNSYNKSKKAKLPLPTQGPYFHFSLISKGVTKCLYCNENNSPEKDFKSTYLQGPRTYMSLPSHLEMLTITSPFCARSYWGKLPTQRFPRLKPDFARTSIHTFCSPTSRFTECLSCISLGLETG